MLSQKELTFIHYWEQHRLLEKKSFLQFIKGLSRGILIGIGMVVLLTLGWYERANMVANSKFNPVFLVIIIGIISIFIAYIYRQYIWEQKEQQYLELKAKQKKQLSQIEEKLNSTTK
jgi:uncharacterized membrane protein